MSITITALDQKNYSEEIVNNYLRLYSKVIKPKKSEQFYISDLETALETIELPEEKKNYLKIFEYKYGLKNGKYKIRVREIQKDLELPDNLDVKEVVKEVKEMLREPKILAIFSADYKNVRKKIYHELKNDEQQNNNLTPIQEYNYVMFYCKLKNKKIEDIPDEDICIEKIIKNISNLTKRQQYIILHRFGLDDGIKLTLKQIGDIYDLRGETIRLCEKKALRLLRHYTRGSYSKSKEKKS